MNNLSNIVKQAQAAIDNQFVFVHVKTPDLQTLLNGLEEQRKDVETFKRRMNNAVRTSVDISEVETLRTEHAAMKEIIETELYALEYGVIVDRDSRIKRMQTVLSTLTKEVEA